MTYHDVLRYLEAPAAPDEPNPMASLARTTSPRGRMDDISWGPTLYRYRSAAAQEATRRYAELAKSNGLSLTELALSRPVVQLKGMPSHPWAVTHGMRGWAKQRNGMSTALLGQTSMEQLEEDLKAMSAGPLSEELLWEIDRVHMRRRA